MTEPGGHVPSGRRGSEKRAPGFEARPQVVVVAGDALPSGAALELHVCAGLNACSAHDADGAAKLAGTGSCATVQHICHGDGSCRGQGGCGYAGTDYEQSLPGEQSCSQNGSCASPINASRVHSAGPRKGKSVWRLARSLFEARMYEAGVAFGPAPSEGYPDDLVPLYEAPYKPPWEK